MFSVPLSLVTLTVFLKDIRAVIITPVIISLKQEKYINKRKPKKFCPLSK